MKKRAVLVWIAVFSLGCLSACGSLPDFGEKEPSYKLPVPVDANLIQFTAPLLASHPGQTGVVPLVDGVDAFIARLAIITAATTSVDLQYYIYRADDTGKLLVWHLLDAAERGVRVRILLDDLTTKELDRGLKLLSNHPNISIRLFNPAASRGYRGLEFVTGFSRMNRRMHNKSLTVDNLATIVGGRNIGNEYFSNDDVDFGDFDLLAIGEAVDEVSNQFDLYWNADVAVPIETLSDTSFSEQELLDADESYRAERSEFDSNPYIGRLELSRFLGDLREQQLQWYWGRAEVVYDPPQKARKQDDKLWLLSDLSTFLEGAEDEVFIVSPYFVPTKKGAAELVAASQSGIKVTVVTNSLAATDVLAVHAGYQGYREALLDGGVKIFEVKADPRHKSSGWMGSSRTSLHAKTFILDRESIFVGSFNFDPRSAWINTEMGMIFHQSEFASGVAAGIDAGLIDSAFRLELEEGELVWFDDSRGLKLHSEPGAGFWRKLMADFISLFPIESQL
ncbi:phospholipase D family protein [uncultured Shewanella sp.]|uniref:phospholipase D family protein n=1 Tax=Shewanella atlantica TaxID=271099 RepID=UPI00261BDF37|nr:phospholipase D family protein [uncultured Shewanella sp.]